MSLRICEAGCGKPIEPPGTAILLIEDAKTPDEYRGFMHAECLEERKRLLNEIKELLNL